LAAAPQPPGADCAARLETLAAACAKAVGALGAEPAFGSSEGSDSWHGFVVMRAMLREELRRLDPLELLKALSDRTDESSLSALELSEGDPCFGSSLDWLLSEDGAGREAAREALESVAVNESATFVAAPSGSVDRYVGPVFIGVKTEERDLVGVFAELVWT